MATVALRKLTKRYGDVEVVRAIDLDIADREFIALVGPSGCGKSTTLRMIAGLEEISGGDVLIGGEIVNDLPPRSRNISMVFQSYALYPHMSVRENMGFSLKVAKRPNDEIARRVAEAAAILHLEPLLDRRPSQLSGGQRQRVALARSLAIEPRVLLLDEPFGALDAKVRKDLRKWLRHFHDQTHLTTLFVTHDQEEAFELADRVAVFNQGRIQQVGSPSLLRENPTNDFVREFLEV